MFGRGQGARLPVDRVEERVVARRAAHARQAARQRDAFTRLQSAGDMVAWLRAELTRRSVGESGLMAAMNADRSGVGINNWADGLQAVGINIERSECDQLFHAVDRNHDGLVSRADVAALFGREVREVERGGRVDRVEERAKRRRAVQARQGERQQFEFQQLEPGEPQVAWLRTEIENRSIGEFRLVAVMRSDRGDTVRIVARLR